MSAERFDAIVVGSGAGGAAAAHRLRIAGLRVLLLEKGEHLPLDGSTLDVGRVVHQGQFLSRERWLDRRGRALMPEEHFNVGGKTKWYGAALLRFAAHEFEPDALHGCPGWPFASSTLQPYYDEAERLLGVRTFESEPDLKRILARLGPPGRPWCRLPMPLGLAADILDHPTEAMRFDGFASVLGLKAEAEGTFLGCDRSDERLRLLTGAEVTALIGDPAAPAIVRGVRLRDGREYRAPRVLLAAGALHSPRILAHYLEVSGLESQLPAARHVGRHLKLHLLTALVAASPRRMADRLRKTVLLTHERFPHSSVQPLGFDAELIASLVPRWIPRIIGREVGQHAYGFFLQTEDGSHPDNRVRGAIGAPAPAVLDYDEWRSPPAAREHRSLTRALQRSLARAGLLAFTRRIGPSGTAHACGTLVCGRSPADSVVDAEGRVHGLQGLYVVDGSVLPRSSRVNPALTIYAWALRAADLIGQGQRCAEAAGVR